MRTQSGGNSFFFIAEGGRNKNAAGTVTNHRGCPGKEGVSQRLKKGDRRKIEKDQGIDRNSKSIGMVCTSAQIL